MRLKRHKYRKPSVCFQINIFKCLFVRLHYCLAMLCYRGVWGVNKIYLKFKAAKTAIVGMMTTPWLSCQFRDIATSSYSHVTTDHLCHRLKQNTINTKQSRTNNWTLRWKKKKNRKKNRKKKNQMWKLNEWNKYNLSSIFFFSQAICDSQIHTNNNYWITNKLL